MALPTPPEEGSLDRAALGVSGCQQCSPNQRSLLHKALAQVVLQGVLRMGVMKSHEPAGACRAHRKAGGEQRRWRGWSRGCSGGCRAPGWEYGQAGHALLRGVGSSRRREREKTKTLSTEVLRSRNSSSGTGAEQGQEDGKIPTGLRGRNSSSPCPVPLHRLLPLCSWQVGEALFPSRFCFGFVGAQNSSHQALEMLWSWCFLGWAP